MPSDRFVPSRPLSSPLSAPPDKIAVLVASENVPTSTAFAVAFARTVRDGPRNRYGTWRATSTCTAFNGAPAVLNTGASQRPQVTVAVASACRQLPDAFHCAAVVAPAQPDGPPIDCAPADAAMSAVRCSCRRA